MIEQHFPIGNGSIRLSQPHYLACKKASGSIIRREGSDKCTAAQANYQNPGLFLSPGFDWYQLRQLVPRITRVIIALFFQSANRGERIPFAFLFISHL